MTVAAAIPAGHQQAGPVEGALRLPLLDALRGAALLGVLLVNLRSLSLYGLLPATERAAMPTAALDAMLSGLMGWMLDGAAITVFSLLFGVGFAMQTGRADPAATRRFVRRMGWLLLIGLLHAWLLWWGDILRYYAVCGLALLALRWMPPRWLAVAGLLVAVAVPVLARPLVAPLLPEVASSAESAAASLAAFSGGDPWAALSANFDRDLRMRVAVWILPAYVLGRLMIGMAIGRSGVLEDPDRHRRFWLRTFVGCLLGGLMAALLAWARGEALAGTGPGHWLRSPSLVMATAMLRQAHPLLLGLAWMAGFVLLFGRARWRLLLEHFVPVGRLALSNYLAQSLLAIGLFYGVGLGIGPQPGLAGILAIGLAIFALQCWLSRWWLQRFRFGPVEWLWRWGTWGYRPSLRSG